MINVLQQTVGLGSGVLLQRGQKLKSLSIATYTDTILPFYLYQTWEATVSNWLKTLFLLYSWSSIDITYYIHGMLKKLYFDSPPIQGSFGADMRNSPFCSFWYICTYNMWCSPNNICPGAYSLHNFPLYVFNLTFRNGLTTLFWQTNKFRQIFKVLKRLKFRPNTEMEEICGILPYKMVFFGFSLV